MKYVESRDLFGNGPTKEIPMSRAEGAPNAATEGDVGCLYMDKNTGAVYKCTAVSEDGERTWVALIDRAEIQSIVDAYNAQNPPKNGEDGGHYTPAVTQPTATTMKVEFTPSKPGMPGVEPVTVTLPERNDSGQNATQYRIKGKTVVFFGDSICEGAGDTGGYAKPIREITGCVTNNLGRSGATVANAGTSTYKIVNMVKEFSGDADMIVIEGGTNDCNQGVALGEITEGYIAELDETTFCGALESIIQTLLTNHPQAQLFGVFTHRDVSDEYTNTNGVSKKEFRDKAIAIYAKYSLPCFDAYKDSGLITAYFTSTGQPAYYKRIADLYTYNGDKTHPNEAGYARYYAPQIIDMLERNCPVSDIAPDDGGNGGEATTINVDMNIVGFTRANGTFSSAQEGRRSDYIPMDGVQSISVKVGGEGNCSPVAFYDSNKVLLSDISLQWEDPTGANLSYGWFEKTIDTTATEYAAAKYFVVSSYHTVIADNVYNGDNDHSHDRASYIKTA